MRQLETAHICADWKATTGHGEGTGNNNNFEGMEGNVGIE